MKHSSFQLFMRSIGYLLTIHVAALIFFTLFRLVLFLSADYQLSAEIQANGLLQSVAFLKGLWFDNVIGCYLLFIPLVVLWVAALFNYTAKWMYVTIGAFFTLGYALSFIVAAANIPYFNYFFKIINSSIFNWFSYIGTTIGMIFGETSYYFPIALGLVSIALWGWGMHVFSNYTYQKSEDCKGVSGWQDKSVIVLVGAVLVGLCLFGIRGRMGYNPIKVSQAYYCEDPFLNQLGINPVFNLLTSTLDDFRKENKRLDLMDENKAIAEVKEQLQREGIVHISPIAQKVNADEAPTHQNVVMVFMESMSAKLMGSFGSTRRLTPFLDSLYRESIHFDNTYSAGIHTNHGLYAGLYSFPAVMKRNAMKGSVIPRYSGLPTVLQDNGYQTLFFMTHESQYDNMNAFLRTNGFDEIYSQENYPEEKVANHFGVQDDYLYEYAIPVLNKKSEEGKPFFSVLLSISNHPPYVIPSYFHPHSDKIEEQIVEYADWSIRKLMTEAEKQSWYENTLFVFLGDHGKLVGNPESEMPESYNHIPFFIFRPHQKGKAVHGFSGQIDIAPTVLGLLNIDYIQNNFGIDLLKERRNHIVYTADNLIAARDSSHLYFYAPETKTEYCYNISASGISKMAQNDVFKRLKESCFATLQSTEYLVKEQLTTDQLHSEQ